MGEGIIDDGDFLAGNPAFKVDRAAAIFKAAVGDECRSRVNILEGIGVIDIGERAVCDGEGTVGLLLPICLLAIGTDDDFLKGAVGDRHISAVQKLEFRVSNLLFCVVLIDSTPSVRMTWNVGRDILKMDIGDGNILKISKYLILGVGDLNTMNNINPFIRFPLDCNARAVKCTIASLDSLKKISKGHGSFRGRGSCGQQTDEQAKAERNRKYTLFHRISLQNVHTYVVYAIILHITISYPIFSIWIIYKTNM